MEVTRVLPPGDQQPLDCVRFAELCRSAMRRTLEDLKDVAVPAGYWTVFFIEEPAIPRDGPVVHPTTMGSRAVLGPQYRDTVVWERIARIWQSPEFAEFADYLWDRGAMKNSFSGPDPSKPAWARYVFAELVHSPLLIAAEETARERLVDGRPAEPWRIDEEKLEEVVADTTALYCERSGLAIARCALVGLTITPGAVLDLAPNVILRHVSARERCIFMSRHGTEFLWDDFKSPLLREVILEARVPFEFGAAGRTENLIAKLRERLDSAKWAIFVAQNRKSPLVEGTCIVSGRRDTRTGRFRRDENLFTEDQALDDGGVRTAVALIQGFSAASERMPELKDGLWYFGRACVAGLPRDVLLESTIGLELLLVPGGGESRFRFSLHGAAVLANASRSGLALFRTLQGIYDGRSGAAHGGLEAEEGLAHEARRLLADALRKITELILSNQLDLTEGLARGVQNYVIERAAPA